MRYYGHKSIDNEPILPDGEYWAVTTNDSASALILPDRNDGRLDKTIYSDAAGNISYETSIFKVRIKNGRVLKNR